LLPEPGDDVSGQIAKVPSHASSLRTDAQITPSIKGRYRNAEKASHLLYCPEPVGVRFHDFSPVEHKTASFDT